MPISRTLTSPQRSCTFEYSDLLTSHIRTQEDSEHTSRTNRTPQLGGKPRDTHQVDAVTIALAIGKIVPQMCAG